MELLVAPVEHITFDIEVRFRSSGVSKRRRSPYSLQVALAQQLGAQPLPFPGMDKSGGGKTMVQEQDEVDVRSEDVIRR